MLGNAKTGYVELGAKKIDHLQNGLTTYCVWYIMQAERLEERDIIEVKEVMILKNTNKHTGANTGTLIYSERAKRRKKRENRRFYQKYNENCGEVISYKLPKEEIEKLLKTKD